jgi:hypothetical protein
MVKLSTPGSPFHQIWTVYEPAPCQRPKFPTERMRLDLPVLDMATTSVTLVMKMRPLSCSFAFLFRVLGATARDLSFLSLPLPGTTSLQHSRMHWNR